MTHLPHMDRHAEKEDAEASMQEAAVAMEAERAAWRVEREDAQAQMAEAAVAVEAERAAWADKEVALRRAHGDERAVLKGMLHQAIEDVKGILK